MPRPERLNIARLNIARLNIARLNIASIFCWSSELPLSFTKVGSGRPQSKSPEIAR